MRYPVDIVFRFFAGEPEARATDAAGRCVGYVHQKLVAYKEDVTVFSDETKATPLYTIEADTLVAATVRYRLAHASGAAIGDLERRNVRSFWRVFYGLSVDGAPRFEIEEQSPLLRAIDVALCSIPVLGPMLFAPLSGLLLNASYVMRRTGGERVLRIRKLSSMFDRHYRIEQLGPIAANEQDAALLAGLMVATRERLLA